MKIKVSQYKKSIHEIGLSRELESILWDFYVTKSVSQSASQKRTVSDYGFKQFPYDEMISVAGLNNECIKILLASSINETLKAFDLDSGKMGTEEELEIEVDESRIVCITPFTIADENPAKAKIGKAESILTHIRNAFAHGNTYFFDNKNILLEDKNQGIITARMILKVQTLYDWIKLIDKNKKFYKEAILPKSFSEN